MPKITSGGGPTNVREEIDPAVPSPAPTPEVADDTPAIEPTRDEDPHAPAKRPGEHTPFFGREREAEGPHGATDEQRPDDDDPGEQEGGSGLPPALAGGETPDGPEEGAEASGDEPDGEDSKTSSARPAKRGGRKAH